MRSKNKRIRIHKTDNKPAYEGPLATLSPPITTQNIPLTIHRDARNGISGLMLETQVMGQFTLAAVLLSTDFTRKWLLWSSTFLGWTSGDVSYKSRFLGEGSPAMGTGAEPSLVLLLVLF